MGIERFQLLHLLSDMCFHCLGMGHVANDDLKWALHGHISLNLMPGIGFPGAFTWANLGQFSHFLSQKVQDIVR